MSEADGKAVATLPAEKREIGEPITEKLILTYMDSFGIGATLTPQEKTQFVNVAVAYKLNPFKREIYCNPYETKHGRKLSIITGYEVYLKRAERIGDLDGWKVTTSGNVKDGSLKAQIVIHRKSWKQPFEHEVELAEYDQKRSVWLDKPVTMLKKVVTAQGFRLAFPDELGGMPYTADELPDNMTGRAVETTAEPRRTHEPAKPSQEPERKSQAQTQTTAQNTQDGAGKPPANPLTATGFVSSASEPNKGGYVSFTLEGVNRADGRPRKLSTRDQAQIAAILDRRDAGEKVSLEYTKNANPAFADNIVKVLEVATAGDAQE